MRSIVCPKYGPPEVLQFVDVQTPVPKERELLIKVHATTVTVADVRCRSFTVPPSYWIPARLSLGLRGPRRSVLGMEFAGVVDSIGSDVKQFAEGDEVFGSTELSFGAYAEYICVPENSTKMLVIKKPANLSFIESAAVPLGARTAWYFLQEADIRPGQEVLIYGASGSVGTYAVQLAKYLGAVVTGVCSGTNGVLVRSLGADTIIDYAKEGCAAGGKKYDVVFEAVGKAPLSQCVQSLKERGTLLHAVSAPDVALRMKWASMRSKKKMVGGGPSIKIEELVFLKDLIETGTLRPVVDRTYPFEQIVEAHRYVDQGHKKGNVVISLVHDREE